METESIGLASIFFSRLVCSFWGRAKKNERRSSRSRFVLGRFCFFSVGFNDLVAPDFEAFHFFFVCG